MNLIKEDLLFGRIALLNKLISQEQLDDALAEQKSQKKIRPIALILQEKGYITKAQLRAILETQKKKLPKPVVNPQERREDMVFAYLAVKLTYTDNIAVHRCLKSQAQMAKKGLLFRLSELLVNQGFIDIKQAYKVLAEQHKRILPCPRCATRYNTLGLQEQELPCKKCGFVIEVPRELISKNEGTEIEEFQNSLEKLNNKDTTKKIRSRIPKFSSLRIISEGFSSDVKEIGETRDGDSSVEDDLDLTYGVTETRQEDEIFEEEEGEDEFITAGSAMPDKQQLQKLQDEFGIYNWMTQMSVTSSEDIVVDDVNEDDVIAISAMSLEGEIASVAAQDYISTTPTQNFTKEDFIVGEVAVSAGKDYVDLEAAGEDYVDLEAAGEDYVDLEDAGEDYVDLEDAGEDYVDLEDAGEIFEEGYVGLPKEKKDKTTKIDNNKKS